MPIDILPYFLSFQCPPSSDGGVWGQTKIIWHQKCPKLPDNINICARRMLPDTRNPENFQITANTALPMTPYRNRALICSTNFGRLLLEVDTICNSFLVIFDPSPYPFPHPSKMFIGRIWREKCFELVVITFSVLLKQAFIIMYPKHLICIRNPFIELLR